MSNDTTASASSLSKAQIDDIVYQCRQSGNDTTYDIVNAAIRASLARATLPTYRDGQEPLTVDDYQAKLMNVFVASFRAGPEGGTLVPGEEMASFYFKHVARPDQTDDVRDAARYRWLRAADWDDIKSMFWSPTVQNAGDPDACMSELDKAIDASIAASLAGKDKP